MFYVPNVNDIRLGALVEICMLNESPSNTVNSLLRCRGRFIYDLFQKFCVHLYDRKSLRNQYFSIFSFITAFVWNVYVCLYTFFDKRDANPL